MKALNKEVSLTSSDVCFSPPFNNTAEKESDNPKYYYQRDHAPTNKNEKKGRKPCNGWKALDLPLSPRESIINWRDILFCFFLCCLPHFFPCCFFCWQASEWVHVTMWSQQRSKPRDHTLQNKRRESFELGGCLMQWFPWPLRISKPIWKLMPCRMIL